MNYFHNLKRGNDSLSKNMDGGEKKMIELYQIREKQCKCAAFKYIILSEKLILKILDDFNSV